MTPRMPLRQRRRARHRRISSTVSGKCAVRACPCSMTQSLASTSSTDARVRGFVSSMRATSDLASGEMSVQKGSANSYLPAMVKSKHSSYLERRVSERARRRGGVGKRT